MTNQRRNRRGRFSTSPRAILRSKTGVIIILLIMGIFSVPLAITLEPTITPISSTPEIGATTTEPELVQNGLASWYDYDLERKDQKCLDEDCWSMTHRTCASRFFKRHSTVIVKNIATGEEVECYVNDRIEHPDRIIDLSSFAFSQLAGLGKGLITVEVRYK